MQRNTGLYKVIAKGFFYSWLQTIFGANYSRRWLVEEILKCKAGCSLVDLGCGTADLLEYLPLEVNYTGVDVSTEYLSEASRRYGRRASFVLAEEEHFVKACIGLKADIVNISGVLHHLDDVSALDLLNRAKEIAGENGRVVCMEPVFLMHHAWLSRLVISLDRGKNIRTEQEWKCLWGKVFPTIKSSILTGLLLIPYTHILMENDEISGEKLIEQ